MVGVHHQQPADSLRATARGIEDAASRRELARVDAEVGELAHVGVGHHLERQRRERGVLVGRALRLAALAVLALPGWLQPLHRRHLERRRQKLHDRVQQRLHALVLERGPAQHRGHLDVQRRPVQRGGDPLVRDLLVVQVRLHQVVVVVGAGLDQVRARLVGLLGQLLGDLPVGELDAQLVGPHQGLVLDQVDDALERVLGADRELDRERLGAQSLPHRLDRLGEVGAGAVHLVDVGDPRDAVLVGLAPDGLRLRLDAGDGVEDGDRPVQHAEGTLDLDREVHVAGGVDDVDAVALPLAGGGRGGDRDAALLLLLHPVHHGGALVHLTHLVRATRVEEDALRGRRLTGVDVRHDPDVSGLL